MNTLKLYQGSFYSNTEAIKNACKRGIKYFYIETMIKDGKDYFNLYSISKII